MRNTDFTEYLKMAPEELLKLQKTRGWIVSFFGSIAYKILKLKHEPKNYRGICKYFEVDGKGWGLEMGWYFVCTKDCSDSTKSHEVGHLIQNAAVGGLQMLFLSIGSMIRFWWRRVFKPKTGYYDDWWFESQASELGNKYVEFTTSNNE